MHVYIFKSLKMAHFLNKKTIFIFYFFIYSLFWYSDSG